MRIRTLIVVVGLALSVQPALAARVALVIGNSAYKESPLRNPVNDARDMSAKLKELGFTVISRENLKRKEIPATLREFRSQIKAGDEALFFYAGHGLQVKGVNYLPAVDADISSEDDVDMESLSVSKLLELLDESKAAVKLVFLDACRNNPYARSFRSTDRGLSRVGNVAPSGTLISFATKPGSVAADGNGRNGLYTEQLLKYMGSENAPVEQVLKLVIRDVKQVSKGAQEPWSEGSLEGDFYFRKGTQVASIAPFNPPSAVLPGTAGVNFADLEKARQEEATARQQWAAWQQRMQADFDKATQFSGAMAVAAWERFSQTYASDNPYSSEDEKLRSEAVKRKVSAQTQVASIAPVKSSVISVGELIAGRYQPLGNGSEIKDTKTGLIWQRCAVGMQWNGQTCTGVYKKYTFDDAQKLAGNGWRVSSKDELTGIIDTSRKEPTINTDAFPATPSNWFWSSSRYTDHPYASWVADVAWRVDFSDGEVDYYVLGSPRAVRLVRGDQ